MKKAFLCGISFTVLLAGISPSYAVDQAQSESEWILIANNSDDTKFYSGKRGSYELSATRAGVPIALILGQIEDKKTKQVTYSKWYVSAADCEAGLGKLVLLKINGDYDSETDYVAKGTNIASAIGDMICAIYISDKRAQEGKGV